MKRRNFLQLIAALAGIPFLPKAAAKPLPNTRNDVIDFKTGIPIGTVQPYLGQQAPEGWLPCDGRVISRYEFPELHSAIGQPGKIPFRLPEMRANQVSGFGQLTSQRGFRSPLCSDFHSVQYIIKAKP